MNADVFEESAGWFCGKTSPVHLSWRGGALAVQPYDDVRAAADPRAAVLDFQQSTFEAGGSRAGWDLDTTRTDWCPVPTGGSRG